MSGFVATSQREGDRLNVLVSCDLDLATAEDLVSLCAAAATEGHLHTIVIDLAQVRFIDSTGIGALVRIRTQQAEAEGELILHNPSARTIRLFDITGLTDVFTIDLDQDDPGTLTSATAAGG